MLLSGEQIRQRNLVENADPSRFRAASYDLRVGKIITPEGTEVASYAIPTQGFVTAISEERLRLPRGVAGYALVKTSLCNDGILAIGIGIIDPTYEGLISSALINFGRECYSLTRGDVFLRIAFHEFEAQAGGSPAPRLTDADYVGERKGKMRSRFSSSFLDIPATAHKVAQELIGKYKTALFVYLPAAAVLLALLTFLLNFSNSWIAQRGVLTSQERTAYVGKAAAALQEENKALFERLVRLEQQIAALREPPARRR